MYRVLSAALLVLLLSLPLAAQARDLAPLVSVDWLAGQLDADDLVVIDIRSAIDGGDREAFEAGHIPGAVYSSYTEAGWRRAEGDVVGMLPPVPDLEDLVGSLGIDNDTDVVIVPAGVGSTDFGSAARIYWTFRVLGHDRVAILNGGHRAWAEAGQPVETGWNAPERAEFRADYRPELIANASDVEAATESGIRLVDNRPAEQFGGEDMHPAARAAGTIPGAVNVDQGALVNEGTAFMVDADTIQALLDQAEVDDNGRTITFCNTGHWAALGWFAMSEIAGYSDVAMYDGSMVEWTQDENRPLQTQRRGLGRILDWFQS